MKNALSRYGGGAFVLLVSGIICKCLGAFFRLPLTNLLGTQGIGMFQLVMSLYSFALVLTCGGTASALSKLISGARASGRGDKVGAYLKYAMLTSLGVGAIIGAVFFLLSKQIAGLQNLDGNSAYMLFLLILPLGGALACLRGYFQGYENMLPTAISQIIEQVARFSLGLLFAYHFAKYGLSQGVFGAFLGVLVSEAVALLYIFIHYLCKRGKKVAYDRAYAKTLWREFNTANLPLLASALIMPLVSAFISLTIISRLQSAGLTQEFATELYGLQNGIVSAILHFPLVISISCTTAMLPKVAYGTARGHNENAITKKGLKSLLYLILPTTFGLVAVSQELLKVLFSGIGATLLGVANTLMFYGAFGVIFTAIMQYVIMILQAHGEFKFILFIVTVGAIIQSAVTFCLSGVFEIGIFAVVIGVILGSAITCVLGLVRLRKIVSFTLAPSEVGVLILGTFLMFVAVRAFVNCAYFSGAVNILLGVILGVVIYVVLTMSYLVKFFKRKDIKVKTIV